MCRDTDTHTFFLPSNDLRPGGRKRKLRDQRVVGTDTHVPRDVQSPCSRAAVAVWRSDSVTPSLSRAEGRDPWLLPPSGCRLTGTVGAHSLVVTGHILATEGIRFFLFYIQMLCAKPRFQISSNYLLLLSADQQHLYA